MKKYANAAIVYSFLALAGGVFYREFTKFNGFGGATSLGSSIRITSCWASSSFWR